MPAQFPAPPAAPMLGAADSVERWGHFTLQGNLALEQGENVKARQWYSEALAAAEEMMVAAARAHDARSARYAPALYGIACNNIIELARQQDDGLTVGIFLCKAAAGFLTVMECVDAPLSLRQRCVLHSRVASAALCGYFEERGMWDAAETYTTRANAAFFSLQRAEPSPAQAAQSPAPAVPSAVPRVPRPAPMPNIELFDPGFELPEASFDPPSPSFEPWAPSDDLSASSLAPMPSPESIPSLESMSMPASPHPTPSSDGPPRPPPFGRYTQPELPAEVWSDAEPALDLSPPRAPIRKSLLARLLDWAARAFRRSPRSLPTLGSHRRHVDAQ